MDEASMVTQTMPDRDEEAAVLRQKVETALEIARQAGADGAEVTATTQSGLGVNVRLGEIETLEHHRDRGIGVTVFLGQSKGHASSADLRSDSIRACVLSALDIARFTQADRCNGLADPDRLATEFPDLDLWHPRPLSVEEAIERALECESAGRADDRISNSEGAAFNVHAGVSVYANTHGFVGASSGTRYEQSCVLVAGAEEGMQRDYWYDSRRAFTDLEPAEATGNRAAERTISRLGARQVGTCQAPVLFAPEVARGLVGHFVSAVSGGALYRNASFLKDSAGQALFPGWLSMREMPLQARGSGSCAFDSEGVATVERNLIDAGVLTAYVLSSYSARRLGLETTGNAGGVHNLCVRGNAFEPAELMAQMGRGLLVTEVMGQGVSIITGDYSRGASGFWIENGQIAHPVEEVTIAGNLRDMFLDVQALGNDVDVRSNIQAGSILIGSMTIAGS
jgi:PmbA protein